MHFSLSAALLLALVLPFSAGAQFLGGAASPSSPFTLSLDPQFPTPNSQATLTPVSTLLDLTTSTMTVTANGKQIYQGSIRPLPIALGKEGGVTNITVVISASGRAYTQTLSIRPQDISLVIEPVSSSPPLYPGKASVPLEGDVRLVAVASLRDANGSVGNPSTYSYVWSVDGSTIGGSSGIGKSSLLVASPIQYRARTVSVTVANQDKSFGGDASVSLVPVDPTLRIYQNDPLLGVRYDHSLSGQFSIANTEVSLYAAPFSLPATNGSSLIQWFLNGSTVQTGPLITLRPTGAGQGTAVLSVSASSGQFSTVSDALSLFFGTKPTTNLFGL